jgi:hypothetical protein
MENARALRFAPRGEFDFVGTCTESPIAEIFLKLHGPPSGLAGGSRIDPLDRILDAVAGHFARL